MYYRTAFWALFSDMAGDVNDPCGIPGGYGVDGSATHGVDAGYLSRAVLAGPQEAPFVRATAGGLGGWWGQDGPPVCGGTSSTAAG